MIKYRLIASIAAIAAISFAAPALASGNGNGNGNGNNNGPQTTNYDNRDYSVENNFDNRDYSNLTNNQGGTGLGGAGGQGGQGFGGSVFSTIEAGDQTLNNEITNALSNIMAQGQQQKNDQSLSSSNVSGSESKVTDSANVDLKNDINAQSKNDINIDNRDIESKRPVNSAFSSMVSHSSSDLCFTSASIGGQGIAKALSLSVPIPSEFCRILKTDRAKLEKLRTIVEVAQFSSNPKFYVDVALTALMTDSSTDDTYRALSASQK